MNKDQYTIKGQKFSRKKKLLVSEIVQIVNDTKDIHADLQDYFQNDNNGIYDQFGKIITLIFIKGMGAKILSIILVATDGHKEESSFYESMDALDQIKVLNDFFLIDLEPIINGLFDMLSYISMNELLKKKLKPTDQD